MVILIAMTFLDLFTRQLIYFVIPVYDSDYIVVPPLQGFVMNRVSGDYFETLLYKVFVTINEHTQVSELANVLQINLQEVKVLCLPLNSISNWYLLNTLERIVLQ